LSALRGGWIVNVVGENAEESPYILMTTQLCRAFPEHGGTFQIEPDASSGSYFWAAGQLVPDPSRSESRASETNRGTTDHRLSVTVANWPKSDWQIDARFPTAYRLLMTRAPDFPFG